jgi:hypothetical protein
MNNPFKAKLWLSKDRAEFIIKFLAERGITVSHRYESKSCIIEFTVDEITISSMFMHFIHAGIHLGINTGLNALKEIHGTTT